MSLYDAHIDHGIRRFGLKAMQSANVGRVQTPSEILSMVPWRGRTYSFSTRRTGKPSRFVHDVR